MGDPAPGFDPGPAVARARADAVPVNAAPIHLGGSTVSVGTASWTDPTLTARGVFYPDGASSAEARLRYYATRFSMVEVDSSFYALPTPANAERWVERTPPHFTFDVKAFALMTGHAARVDRLPRVVRDALPAELATARQVTANQLPDDVVDQVWRLFVDAVRPLADAGRLGAVFLQYPPWVGPSRAAPPMLRMARERLDGLPIAVELRNARWLTPRLRDRTFDLLRDLGLSYVVVDEPQGMASSVPPDVAVTSPSLAVLRLHGRRGDLWERRGVPVVEKYRYLYSVPELQTWRTRIEEMGDQAERLHIVFNNCYANYGVCNATEMARLLSG